MQLQHDRSHASPAFCATPHEIHDFIAYAIPIAGDGRPAWAPPGCGLGSVALWAFDGDLDDVVHARGSIEPMTNLAACPVVPPNRARLTVHPGLYHDGWDQACSGSLGDDIYTWMLAFSRPQRRPAWTA